MPEQISLQLLWPSNYVIENAPSGVRYEVSAGQVIVPQAQDLEFLKQLSRPTGGCCGMPKSQFKLFKEV